MPLVSDYGRLDDISDRLAIPSLIFTIITPIVVFARILSRRLHGNQVGPDDWTILASLLFAETVNIQMIICCQWGFGKHTDELPRSVVSKTLELFYYAQIFYKVNICLTKISILLFYLRVFKVVSWFKKLCWTVGGIVLAFTIASVFASIFQCIPVAFAYDKTIPDGSCIDLTSFWYGNAGYNIGTDLIIIILPILVIRTLSIPRRTRIALIAVFGLGIFVCITSILRFTTLDLATVRTDSMWQSIDSSMWTIIETNLAIIVACIPAFRKSLVNFFPLFISKVRRTAGGSTAHGHGHFSKSKHPASSDNDADVDAPGNSFLSLSKDRRCYTQTQSSCVDGSGSDDDKKRTWSDNNNSSETVSDSDDTASGSQKEKEKEKIKVKTTTMTTTSVISKTNGHSYLLDDLSENGRKSTTAMV